MYKYGYKYIQSKLYTSGNTLIDNTPVPLDKTFIVTTYDNLNSLQFNPYQFSISFNLYLYPIAANNTDFTILTFSNYLYIQYNSYLNHLTLWRLPTKSETSTNSNNPILIYRQTNVPLQSWITYEINFINETCDVFVNNTLKTSTNIPIYNNNTPTNVVVGNYLGEVSLIQGNIKNLILYNYPLNTFQISMVK